MTKPTTLTALAAITDDLICTIDADGKFSDVSASFSRVLGWTEGELLERPWSDFVLDEDRPRATRELGHLTAGGSAAFHARLLRADGAAEWVKWKAYQGSGEVYSIMLVEPPPSDAKIELTLQKVLQEHVADIKSEHKSIVHERDESLRRLGVAERQTTVQHNRAQTLQVLVGAAITIASAIGGVFVWAMQRVDAQAALQLEETDRRKSIDAKLGDNAERVGKLETDVKKLGRVAVEQQIVLVESMRHITDKIELAHPKTKDLAKPESIQRAEEQVDELQRRQGVDALFGEDNALEALDLVK